MYSSITLFIIIIFKAWTASALLVQYLLIDLFKILILLLIDPLNYREANIYFSKKLCIAVILYYI